MTSLRFPDKGRAGRLAGTTCDLLDALARLGCHDVQSLDKCVDDYRTLVTMIDGTTRWLDTRDLRDAYEAVRAAKVERLREATDL